MKIEKTVRNDGTTNYELSDFDDPALDRIEVDLVDKAGGVFPIGLYVDGSDAMYLWLRRDELEALILTMSVVLRELDDRKKSI